MVYEKSLSSITEEIDAPEWIHKHIIGRKGENIRKINDANPKVSSRRMVDPLISCEHS